MQVASLAAMHCVDSNRIGLDLSALESLESINARLKDAGVAFHLSEVTGPVMDKLERSGFLPHLTGKVFLSHHKAVQELVLGTSPEEETIMGWHEGIREPTQLKGKCSSATRKQFRL